MAKIVIKDLEESRELDRKAMASIVGGMANIVGTSRGDQGYSRDPFSLPPTLFSYAPPPGELFSVSS
jgi:hypothetical protein